MSWIKIDDGFPDHPKILAAGPLGVTALLRGLCWSSRHLTDGYIPQSLQANIFEGMNGFNPEKMVECGLWEVVAGGWQIHDYLDYNISKKEVVRKRKETAKRVREWRRGRNAVTVTSRNAVSNSSPGPVDPGRSPLPVSKKRNISKPFEKPTLEEVREFIETKGAMVDPVAWYSHYESNGWKVGPNKMQSWKAAVWTWDRKARKEAGE